jgi:glycerophosphoryl diester phosphodiesterase
LEEVAITAHRGASAHAPENSLAAVKRAIADNTDWVEIDVQETADGIIVLAHDQDLKKVAGMDLKIGEATYDQLRHVDIGRSFSPEFAGERIPTLEEVLTVCKGHAGLNIELKYYGHEKKLEERVIELVEAHDMASDVVVMSLKHEGVQKTKALRPSWTVGLLTAVAIGNLTKVEADFLAVNAKIATSTFIHSAHRRGKEVYVWTINDPVLMSDFISRGVDNIITDKPALARSVLAQRAQMTPAERLLVRVGSQVGLVVTTAEVSGVEDA